MAVLAANILSPTMKTPRSRAASPTPSIGSLRMSSNAYRPETPLTEKSNMQKSSSSPDLQGTPAAPGTPNGKKKMGVSKKLNSIRKRIGKGRKSGGGGGGDHSVVSGEGTDGSESGADLIERVRSSKTGIGGAPQPPAMGGPSGTPPRPAAQNSIPAATSTATTNTASSSSSARKLQVDTQSDARETIDGRATPTPANVKSRSQSRNTQSTQRESSGIRAHRSTSSNASNLTEGPLGEPLSPGSNPAPASPGAQSPRSPHSPVSPVSPRPIVMPTISPPPPFQFISDDNFTRRVDSYDGQVITCSDSKLPTYEVGNYLGGGVAGVVYEGKRLRPVHEYPPVRVRGGGAFYPATSPTNAAVGVDGSGLPNAPPVAMTMSSSSLSSIRRERSAGAAAGPRDTVETGTGLFADVYRAVVPRERRPSASSRRVGADGRRTPGNAARGTAPATQPDDAGGCTSFLFGNCGFDDRAVDDRAVPLAATPMDDRQNVQGVRQSSNAGGVTKERYQAVDMASIEVPAAFSSMEQEATPTTQGSSAGGGGFHHQVVVDDADAPNRSRREARALSRNAPRNAAGHQGFIADEAGRKRSSSFVYDDNEIRYDDNGNALQQTHLIEDMSETVAIKILNPVGFRLLDPETLHKAVIVREGALPAVEPDGSFVLREEHVWWLVNPNSRNLRSLLRKNAGVATMSSHRHGGQRGVDDASEESSLKRQHSLTQGLGGGGVDRGSPERGLRLSLVATYVDTATKTLRELPLPRCVEIWGHPPFAATDEEFEAMMEMLLRLNAGGGSRDLKRKGSSSGSRGVGRTHSNLSRGGDDPPAPRRGGSTVFCPALSAYIAIPAVPPKYLRWLKQRRLATKEVRNMMRIGRHSNVVHLYEVLEMVQDSKSTMFLILELVRGGELFDLISSNGSSGKRKSERCGGGAPGGNELHEVTMRKFFRELASGINFIHSCGVAHRDLKPENLLIHTKPAAKDKGFESMAEDNKTLKIADFGLSAAFQLHPSPGNANLLQKVSRGDSSGNGRWDGNSVYDSQAGVGHPRQHASGLPLSPQSNGGSPRPAAGLSPLLNRVGATALSMLTCGSMANVCADERGVASDLEDDGYGSSAVDLRRMTSVVGSPHYVAPEIIAQADRGGGGEGAEGGDRGGKQPQDRRARHAARAGYDGTKADVWSAGVILYAMLFRSLPFGEDLLRCPRYQAFRKWYGDARQLFPPQTAMTGKRNRRAVPESALDPLYDQFDEEEMLGPHWFFPSEISAPGRDLIVAMLNPNPNDRLTIEMVLRHPWLLMMANGEGGDIGQRQNQQRSRGSAIPGMDGLCISGT